MIAVDAEQIVKSTIPNLLNNNPEKLKKMAELVKVVEDYTGINALDINRAAFGFNFTNPKKNRTIPNLDFTLIVKTNKTNTILLEEWAKKYDRIFAFEKERAASQAYIESFKIFNGSDYSKSLIEKRKDLLPKIQANLSRAKEINTRVSALPVSETTVEIIKENAQIVKNLEKLVEILQSDITLGDLSEKATQLIDQWNKVAIDDPDKTVKLNQILTEAKNIYPIYARKYDHSVKSEKLLYIVDVF